MYTLDTCLVLYIKCKTNLLSNSLQSCNKNKILSVSVFSVEPDPGGTTLINPDQNVSATTSLTSNTSSPVAVTNTTIPVTTTKDLSYLDVCPDSAPCEHLSVQCLDCRMNHYCFYGSQPTANCTVKPEIKCIVSILYCCTCVNMSDLGMLVLVSSFIRVLVFTVVTSVATDDRL